MANYQKVVEMFGENLASWLSLFSKWIEWKVDFKKILHQFHQIKKEELLGLMNGNYKLVFQSLTVEENISQPTLDFLIKVDRSKKPTYPDWKKKVLHPEFELSGLNEFDLKNVSLWLHENQKTGYATGNQIYNQLKKDDSLKDCLNLADLIAMQEKGIEVFRTLYKGKAVFGWKSVVEDTIGDLYVPYLFESNGEVVLGWGWLSSRWDSINPALRFSK